MYSVASLNLRRGDSGHSTLPAPRRKSFTFPDRFRDGDDAHIDVTAPRSKHTRYMNQSFLSMIANVGSNIAAEPQNGSDNETLERDSWPSVQAGDGVSQSTIGPKRTPAGRLHQTNLNSVSEHPSGRMTQSTPGVSFRHKAVKKKKSKSRLAMLQEDMSSSQILPPRDAQPSSPAEVPVDTIDNPDISTVQKHYSEEEDEQDAMRSSAETTRSSGSSPHPALDHRPDLASRVAEIFEFAEPEHIVTEMPCWLVQNVVVSGRIYVTAKHICFYAFLPRKTGAITKSGFFSKRGPRNPTYHRYWFILKGSVLSYYQSASSLYFPQGTIDLRSAVSAQLEEAADDGTGRGFSIITSQRSHRFKAESVASAQEWVKKIQQSIFHSHNVGNSVKISLPIRNVLEIEDNPMFQRWDTLKIKAVDNEETFAIDEYFFSFMNHDNEPLELLRKAVSNHPSNRRSSAVHSDLLRHDQDGFKKEPLRAMNLIGETMDVSSADITIPTESMGGRAFSDESFDDVSNSSAAEMSGPDFYHTQPVSASNILQGSDIFHESRIKSSKRPQHTSQSPSTAYARRRGSDSGESPTHLADSASTIQPSTSSSRLGTFMRASNASIQRASGIADVLRTQSLRVGSRLANESKTYYEKVTGMWSGKVMHFDSLEAPTSRANLDESEIRNPDLSAGQRFRNYFALSETEKLQAAYHAYLLSGFPVYGKLYLSSRKLCFRALLPGTRLKMILPLRDIVTIDKARGMMNLGYAGLIIVVSGHEELFLEFSHPEARDDLAVTLQRRLSNTKDIDDSRVMTEDDARDLETAQTEFNALEQARRYKSRPGEEMFESVAIDDEDEVSPVIFDDIDASIVDFRPPKSLRVVCLTIGSRGDVQPYIALCKGLKADGHRPLIATHAEFESWIRKHDIDFAPVAGNPAEIMQLCVENDMFTMSFFREVGAKMRPWFDALLDTAWQACQGADVLIESPSAMAGIHIAQALHIPYFRAFSMLWTRTRAYPHAFVVPKQKLGGNYNYLSYVIVDKFMWQASASQVNRWRVKTLGLAPTSFERLKLNSVPFLYNFSPFIVPRPLDFSPWIHVTGNWFLDESHGYEPPEELADFIDRARGDGKKLVYVGFGSMVVENRAAITKTIVDSVLKAGVRCIFSKGWSDRLQGPYDSAEISIPPELIVIKSAPHDWLFNEIDAAVHHGGAGTTAASLRTGIPTVVKPFFGDQHFYGARVEDLGVGRCLDKFNTSVFSRALWEVTHNERIIQKARELGEQIRSEDGVSNAIQTMYRDLEYAKSLIQKGGKGVAADAVEEDTGQDWTMVDDEFENIQE